LLTVDVEAALLPAGEGDLAICIGVLCEKREESVAVDGYPSI
jgi:hypothetical protein